RWWCRSFLRAEDGIRGFRVTGVQTCALPSSADPYRALGLRRPDGRARPGRHRRRVRAVLQRPAPVGGGAGPHRLEGGHVPAPGRPVHPRRRTRPVHARVGGPPPHPPGSVVGGRGVAVRPGRGRVGRLARVQRGQRRRRLAPAGDRGGRAGRVDAGSAGAPADGAPPDHPYPDRRGRGTRRGTGRGTGRAWRERHEGHRRGGRGDRIRRGGTRTRRAGTRTRERHARTRAGIRADRAAAPRRARVRRRHHRRARTRYPRHPAAAQGRAAQGAAGARVPVDPGQPVTGIPVPGPGSLSTAHPGAGPSKEVLTIMSQSRRARRGTRTRTRRRRYTVLDYLLLAGIVGGGIYLILMWFKAPVPVAVVAGLIGAGYYLGTNARPRYPRLVWRRGRCVETAASTNSRKSSSLDL